MSDSPRVWRWLQFIMSVGISDSGVRTGCPGTVWDSILVKASLCISAIKPVHDVTTQHDYIVFIQLLENLQRLVAREAL